MSKTLGFYNLEKRTGKTVSCAFFAECLANLNLKVLAIDLDPSFGLSKYVSNPDFKVSEVKKTIKKLESEWDLWTIGDGIIDNWQAEIDQLKQQYDYLIFDFPSQQTKNTDLVLTNIESVIIPIISEFYGLDQLEVTLNKVLQYKELEIEGILLTMVDQNNKLTQNFLKTVNDNFQELVFKTTISRSYYLGLSEFTIESLNKSFTHFGFADYLRLTNEIING